MQVTVLFFGMLKDVTGIARRQMDLEPGSNLAMVWEQAVDLYPNLAPARPHTRLALNCEFSDLSATVSPGDEIAFLPPVSGGTNPLGKFFLTRDAIDTRALVQFVQTPADGAVATFEGIVRDNTNGRPTEFLEYECYEAMALRMIGTLGSDLQTKYKIGRIAIAHRLGRILIGEASVVIAVAAPHRKPAFEACFEAINRLKATVPIWKKEHFAGGEVWVEGAWDENAAVS